MSCSANSDLPMKIGIRIQSANTVLTQFDTALISDKSFVAVCRSTHVQAVSLDPNVVYIYIYIYIYIYTYILEWSKKMQFLNCEGLIPKRCCTYDKKNC